MRRRKKRSHYALGQDEQQALQETAQALLNRPWITKEDDPDTFRMIKEHFELLREWFYDRAGYSLIVTRHFAKLEKVPASFQPWMGIRSFYTPRDYALFTYGLWYLEGKSEAEQFLLTEMVNAIRDHLLGLDADVNWEVYEHRLSMARALKKLRELGVLVAVEGDEADWAREGSERQNVLYEASPMAKYVLRRFPRDLMTYDHMDDLIAPDWAAVSGGAVPATPEGEIAAKRHRVFRRLMLEPVVYDWQWTEEERRYVQTQRAWLLEQMRSMLGLEGRRFREGLVFWWPELTGEMELFPTQAAQTDLVLLLAGAVREILAEDPVRYSRDEHGNLVMTRAELEGILLRLKEAYQSNWSKELREKASAELADELIRHLEEWNLGAREGALTVKLYPALARWTGMYDAAEWEA